MRSETLKPKKRRMSNITLTMIKPDAFSKNFSGKIMDKIYDAGFTIRAMKLTRLSEERAKQFYAVHSERPFFNDLIRFMTSGPIIAAILEKDNAVDDFRKLIGSTNPEEAEEGTIRKAFAENIERNAVHGSDSNENAQIEASFFFSGKEIF